jgi:hypothetical protein
MMKKIEQAVAGKSHNYEPQSGFEANYGQHQERAGRNRLDDHHRRRCAHRSEQDIVQSDCDRHSTIEDSLAVETHSRRTCCKCKRKHYPDQVFH